MKNFFKRFKVVLMIYGILFIVFFTPLYLFSKNFIFSFLIVVIFIIIIRFIVWISDNIGLKCHKNIFKKQIFKNLIIKDYRVEIIGKYQGLIKTIDKRTVRIFYNWSKKASGFLSFADLEINIYYKPIFSDEVLDEVNLEKLKSLNKKYGKSFWSKSFFPPNKIFIFDFEKMRIILNYYPWTKSDKIEKEISHGLKILGDNYLEPLDVKKLIDPIHVKMEKLGYFLPNIDLVWEYIESNIKVIDVENL